MNEELDIESLWQEYAATKSESVREALIIHYSPLVKFVASRVGVGLPQSVDPADLASYGIFGLIDAIDKFDLERGFKFETYAIPRIRGSIIDELRSIDWVPRSVRTKAREIERTHAKLEADNKRTPSVKEVALELGITEEELHRSMGQISQTSIMTLDDVNEDNQGTLVDQIPDSSNSEPFESSEIEEIRDLMAHAFENISARDRIVLTLYYYEDLTLAKIGCLLGVTESRVCQIHTNAIISLYKYLPTSRKPTKNTSQGRLVNT